MQTTDSLAAVAERPVDNSGFLEVPLRRRIRLNKARCGRCRSVITSRSWHDFRTCPCGSLSADGGQRYLRRIFDSEFGYQEMSSYEVAAREQDAEGRLGAGA